MSEAASEHPRSRAAGRDPLPLDTQRRLAAFAIAHLPSLSRSGHRLRAQGAAAADFHEGRTATHNASPPRS